METKSIATSRSPSSWAIIGDPADVRVRLFSAALAERGMAPRVVDYRRLLDGAPAEFSPHELVRIESPGRAIDLTLKLIARAGGVVSRVERGQILWPALWYRGFTSLLGELRAARWLNHPDEIALLFDKRACHRFLDENRVPVPPALAPVECFEQLRASMKDAGWSRAFVKLRYGSGGAGIVAYARDRESAWTTVEVSRGALYNTRKIRRLESARQIAEVVDGLCAHEVHVERWIPKAGLAQSTCDLRMLVIAGRPAHAVVRLAKSPITNLHLLNRRAGIALLRERMSDLAWQSLLDTCARAAALFPRSLHIALDLAITPSFERHFVLEANAFGDLLKDITLDGRTTYQHEIDAVCAWT